ncbi:MAG: site-specific integrase [Lachnospiraceae bacterium]|nr:site-specific integrase [Lachnospiraceae bacterium]
MPVYRDEDGKRWRAVYRVTLRDGTVRQKSKRGFRTKKEAEEFIIEATKLMKTDMGMTLKTFIENKYMPDIKCQVKERTYMAKEHIMKTHVYNSSLARMSMSSIKAQDIIAWQNEILKHGYSDCYNRTVNNQIVAAFNHAERFYELEKNPCRGVKKIGKSDAEKKMIRYWTKEEFDRYLDSMDKKKDAMYHLLFSLQYYCGFRIGETLALTKRDLDFDEKSIMISKTYDRRERRDIVTEPKTKSSVRKVFLPDALCDELKQYVESLYKYPMDERLFPVVVRAVEKKMHRQMEKVGIKNIIRVHDLRHSCASFYLSQGADMYAIQRLLGHASIDETIRTYSHFSPQQDRQIANLVNALNQKNTSG